MKPGDLFKCHQNIRRPAGSFAGAGGGAGGNIYDFSGCLGLVIGSYSLFGDRWLVLIDGKTCIIYRSDIEYVVQRGCQIETG